MSPPLEMAFGPRNWRLSDSPILCLSPFLPQAEGHQQSLLPPARGRRAWLDAGGLLTGSSLLLTGVRLLRTGLRLFLTGPSLLLTGVRLLRTGVCLLLTGSSQEQTHTRAQGEYPRGAAGSRILL